METRTRNVVIAVAIIVVVSSIGFFGLTEIAQPGGPTSINNLLKVPLEVRTGLSQEKVIPANGIYDASGSTGNLYVWAYPTSKVSFQGHIPTCTLHVSDYALNGTASDNYPEVPNGYLIVWSFSSLVLPSSLDAKQNDAYFSFSGTLAGGAEVGGTSYHFLVQGTSVPQGPSEDPVIHGPSDMTLVQPDTTRTLSWSIIYYGTDKAHWGIWQAGGWHYVQIGRAHV